MYILKWKTSIEKKVSVKRKEEMRNLRRKTLVRCLRKLFSIIVATVGVAWFLDLFTIWQKKKKKKEDLQKNQLPKLLGI